MNIYKNRCVPLFKDIAFLLVFTVFITIGCQGDAGTPGTSLLPQDIQVPEVILVSPDGQRNIFNRVLLEAYAADDSSLGNGEFKIGSPGDIEQVEFLIDGVIPGNGELTLNEPPWQIQWDCSHLSDSVHSFQARAWDEAGRYGLSSVVLVKKGDPAIQPTVDTLSSFIGAGITDVRDNDDINERFKWKLPDEMGRYTGFGTRFTPRAPCQIRYIYVMLYVDYEWTGTRLMKFEIRNANNNRPDSLLYVDTTYASWKRVEPGGTDWARFNVKSDSILVSGDFFFLVTPVDNQPDDTLGFFVDDGYWRNYHGVKHQDGEWILFSGGPRVTYNPLIYAIVKYD
ncbi:MAG: hypothetical protein P9X24_14495 [Candidatus Hatepunaea meridiana]|nr:hypothetical protein [Candidatus Hatepunaea meridiana]